MYYKGKEVLQQSGAIIFYYKAAKWYYKVRQTLQSGAGIKK